MSDYYRTSYYLNSRHISGASSRFSYIERIAQKLISTIKLLPEPNEEQLYEEALSHLVDVLSTKRYPLMDEGCDYDCKNEWCDKGKNKKMSLKREERMEAILNKLKRVERRRLYDPPSDAEIGFYRLIKKYIRSMGVFFTSRKNGKARVYDRFDCLTLFHGLHYLEELEESNAHMGKLSACLAQMMNVTKVGYDVKRLLGIGEMDEVPRARNNMVCGGSKVRNNLFYYHKFRFALFDLVSSHHAFSPPCPEEKKCYEQVLDHIIVPPPQPTITITEEGEGEVSVCSDDLVYVFFTRLLDNMRTLEKHCGNMANDILAKLSIRDNWEKLASHCTMYGVEEEEEVEGISCFTREALQNCNVSSAEELECHVGDVDRFLQICNYVMEFINCLGDLNYRVCSKHSLYRSNSTSLPSVVNAHREVLHASTLFKNGCSFPALNELGEKDMLRNVLQPCGSKMKNQDGRKEAENGNVEMLKEILEE